MKAIFAFVLGVIFALGLLLSGMSNPEKVLGFLDITGAWDMSLAWVMGGAISVAFIPFQYAVRHNAKTFGQQPIQLPSKTEIDTRLIVGSALFGIGWGIAGICPAPSLSLLGLGQFDVVYFIVAMLLGMWLVRFWIGVNTK